jgi:hypothetical protein
MRRHILPDLAALAALLVMVPRARGPLQSYDVFFHMASGRWLLDHRAFPSVDPFSLTATAQYPHEWSWGIFCELAARAFGAAGPEILVALVAGAGFLLIWRTLGKPEERGLWAALLFAAALSTQSFTWNEERPYHFGHLCFALVVLLAQHWRRGHERAAWLVIPLVALWTNLHGSWLLGPAFFGATAAGRMLDGFGDPAERKKAFLGGVAAVGGFLASAIAPAGIHNYTYVIHHALLPSTQTINEWAPLDFGFGFAKAMMVMGVLVAVGASRLGRGRLVVVLPAAALAWAAWGARRHSPFAGIALAAAAAELLREAPAPKLPEALAGPLSIFDRGLRAWSAGANGWAVPLVALAAIAVSSAQHPLGIRDRAFKEVFPLAAIDALKELPPGKVLNKFEWGGAISYFDGPEFKTFIDNRNDPYPNAVHDDYHRMATLDAGWREAFQRYAPDYVVWGGEEGAYSHPLIEILLCQGEWKRAAEDKVGVLLVRNVPSNPSNSQ